MKTFSLQLFSTTEQTQIDGVTSFVGEDASGSFGLLAGRARLMTSLIFGLARFRCGDTDWQYLALPGALLYFVDNRLQICTRRYLLDSDYERISTVLQQQLLAEEQNVLSIKTSLRRMEDEMLRRLSDLAHDRVVQMPGGR